MAFSGIFPPTDMGFTEGEDSKYYGIELEDKTIRSSAEGGYELTRPRFTRKGRKTFTTGFTEMSATDYETFMLFWEDFGGSKSFTWYNQAEQKNYTVRFAEPPSFTYSGVGEFATYNVEVKLKQV